MRLATVSLPAASPTPPHRRRARASAGATVGLNIPAGPGRALGRQLRFAMPALRPRVRRRRDRARCGARPGLYGLMSRGVMRSTNPVGASSFLLMIAVYGGGVGCLMVIRSCL